MKRAEFLFAIGYSGKNAVVDKKAMAQFGALSGRELAERGLYRASFASALHSGAEAEMREFIEIYSRVSGRTWKTAEELSRVFGVYPAPDVKVLLL